MAEVTADDLITAVDNKISAVRTSSLDLSMNELADMYNGEELVISPDFQRMFRWSPGAQSRFIESLVLELPVPPIFLIEREDRVYELIDGLQRISSYLHFRGLLKSDDEELNEPLVLQECDIVPELNGFDAKSMPRALDIKIKRSYIRAEILRKESDSRLRYYMFKRLNTGGEILSAQEVRNATIRLLSADFNSFIIRLSQNEDFKYAIDILTDDKIKQKYDQELVLRFFSFKNDMARYKHDVGDFLTDYMEKVSDPANADEFDFSSEQLRFEKTFRLLRLIAEELNINSKIFGANTVGGEPTGQFSVYHFDGLTLGLQDVIDRIDPTNTEQVAALASAVREGKADKEFRATTGSGRNYPGPMKARVAYFANKFEATLDSCQ